MKKIKRIIKWYCMLSKRLLLKWSFIVLLCLIPVIVPIMNNAMSDTNGVLKVMLCSEDDDELSVEMVDILLNSDSMIDYERCNSVDEATAAVRNHKVDAAWVFKENFTEKAEAFFYDKYPDPLVRVIESEPDVTVRLAREILFGTMYKSMSYYIYKDYVYENFVPRGKISDVELRECYNSVQRGGDIIELVKVNPTTPTPLNHLTAPLRGLLSMLIVLCTMAAALYFLQDQQDGKYAWMQPSRRIIPAFASCLSAAVLSAAAVLLALYFSEIFTSVHAELLAMLQFVFAATGFVLVISGLFKSPGKFGAVIPSVLIVMLVLSPIFFNLKILKPIRLILPTHYYLNIPYNSKYYLYTTIYCVVIYAAAFLVNFAVSKKNK